MVFVEVVILCIKKNNNDVSLNYTNPSNCVNFTQIIFR